MDATQGLTRREELLLGLSLLASLLTAWIVFSPGTGGGFLFDDYSNLPGLSHVTSDPTPYSALQYIFNGGSSLLGRPLSLASFALQHSSWPKNAEDFVRVNIALHLLNGVLLFAIACSLMRLGGIARQPWLPAASMILWLLAPIQGGAVLYVVQRMAVLACTCVFGGLLLHLHGRKLLRDGHRQRGYGLMTAGVAIGLGLGTLAKENAALYPLLALTIELTLLSALPRLNPVWSGVFLWAPTVLLAAYLGISIPQFLDGYAIRGFTLAERLLTESRVLFLYLAKAAVPSPAGIRILYDDLTPSVSLLQPWTTLICVLAWIGLLIAAIRLRRRAPPLSFAVLWYLGSHLMESSVVPLELAFDHRNYLPLAGPALALAAGFGRILSAPQATRLRPGLLLAGITYVVALAAAMSFSARLWANPVDQARYWIRQQPDSQRAWHQYGEALLQRGRLDEALQLYLAAQDRWPEDAVVALSLLEFACFNPGMVISDDGVIRAIRATSGHAASTISQLSTLAQYHRDGKCAHGSAEELQRLALAALESPWLRGHHAILQQILAKLADVTGNTTAALAHLNHAIELAPHVGLLQQAVMGSLQTGDPDRARRYLDLVRTDPRISAVERWTHRREIDGMRQLIELYESLPEEPAIGTGPPKS